MKLHYRTIGEGEPLFILHGLFGSADNWQTLGKRFAEKHKVYFVDQRNHGHSPHSSEFSYELMSADFYELVTDLGYTKINILGHSMGGKTAIQFAKDHGELIDKLIVVDISHKGYPLHHDQILEGLNALDLKKIKSRGAADEALSSYISEISVRQFLLKNLYWIEQGKLAWRINLPVLTAKISTIVSAIDVDRIQTPTLFIRGGRSNYILESDFENIRSTFPNSQIVSIEESGHWVHAEAPEEFCTAVMDFLAED